MKKKKTYATGFLPRSALCEAGAHNPGEGIPRKNAVLKKQHAPRATNFDYHPSQEKRTVMQMKFSMLIPIKPLDPIVYGKVTTFLQSSVFTKHG